MGIAVVPIESGDLELLAAGTRVFTAGTGIAVAPGYLAFPEALEYSRERLNLGMEPAWSTHLILDTDENELVGMGGFNGPPLAGLVELGMSIAPARQGEGIGTTAIRLLTDSARSRGATTVCAFTVAAPGPSPSMLVKCGFAKTAEIADEDEGLVWRWDLSL